MPEASRRLLLLRHAAAEPFGSGDDFGRALTSQGRQQAQLLGKKLAAVGAGDAAVIASDALRVRQTLELALGGDVARVDFRSQLFRASESDWLDVLHQVHDGVELVLLAGHNPVMGQLASLLAGRPTSFATCDLVVLAVAEGWPQVAPACARLVEHWHAR